jgi:hypothetical protein
VLLASPLPYRIVLILTNLGAARTARTVQVNQGLLSAKVMLEENSVATLVWK